MPRRNERVRVRNTRGRYALPREVFKAGVAAPTILSPQVESLVLPDGRCPGYRGKVGYQTEAKASEALKQVRHARRFQPETSVERRVYECPIDDCGLWHLSKREEYDAEQAKRLYNQRQEASS